MEYISDGSLDGLFDVLAQARRGGVMPEKVRRVFPAGGGSGEPDLFGGSYGGEEPPPPRRGQVSRDFSLEAFSGNLPGELSELSVNAFRAFIHAWMSEYPIDTEIVRFGLKVLSAGKILRGSPGSRDVQERARYEAERIARDRGDRDVRIVLEAAFKVSHEIDRLKGLLRFSPGKNGFYIARCAPDHFVLPALGPHFNSRFGEEPWAVADEKRSLILIRERGDEARTFPLEDSFIKKSRAGDPEDPWEELWKNYCRSINNESRNNPALRRQFMPERYWKYLPEMSRRSG